MLLGNWEAQRALGVQLAGLGFTVRDDPQSLKTLWSHELHLGQNKCSSSCARRVSKAQAAFKGGRALRVVHRSQVVAMSAIHLHDKQHQKAA